MDKAKDYSATLDKDGKEILSDEKVDTEGLDCPRPLSQRLPALLARLKTNIKVTA